MQVNATKKLALDLPGTREITSRIADILSRALTKLNVPEPALFDVKLATQEAVANAVEHGNCCDETKKVHVTCEVDDGVIIVTVRDDGEGFDPAGVPDPTRPENILKEHGRGIFLMRNLCDEIRFNDKGNEVTIVKRIPR